MPSDVRLASTDDGELLPIIDVTHPAFAVDAAELAERERRFVDETRESQQMTPAQQAALIEPLRDSRLWHGMTRARGGFIDGMTTYRMKLGTAGLAADAPEIERRLLTSLPLWGMRLRLQQVATLLAGALGPLLARDAGRPLALVTIAGGTAMDALNALLLVGLSQPAALTGRTIAIHVLELDEAGPAFAAHALAALSEAGSPLHQLDVRLERTPYDWNATGTLASLLDRLRAADTVVAVSCEGGLFEYGSDDAIVANLETVHAHAHRDAVIAGSVTRGDGVVAESQRERYVATIPRTIEAFAGLAARGGWGLDAVLEGPIGRQVRLKVA
jgi:hypothetical protein